MRSVKSYNIQIWLGLREGYEGQTHDPAEAVSFLLEYCNDHALCVTVTPTTFIYVGGIELGVMVGLINYPRFPKEHRDLLMHAKRIAKAVRKRFKQYRVSLTAPDKTIMYGNAL